MRPRMSYCVATQCQFALKGAPLSYCPINRTLIELPIHQTCDMILYDIPKLTSSSRCLLCLDILVLLDVDMIVGL